MLKKLTSSDWSKFWLNKTTTSFYDIFQDNYSGEIKSFWFEQLSKISDDATVLDLATGNGALPFLFGEYATKYSKSYTVNAIDYSKINPSKKKIKQYQDFL